MNTPSVSMPATTPRKLSSEVIRFCKRVNSAHEPVYVRVDPDPHAVFDECFLNVHEKVSRDGGKIIYGWSIWMWPNVYIEAEHHAVWCSQNNQLIDITPKRENEKRILFVPDPLRVFDEKKYKRTNNIKQALIDDPDVKIFLQAADDLYKLAESHSVGNVVTVPADELYELERIKDAARHRLLVKFLKRNDNCYCGTGKNIKNVVISSDPSVH